MFNLIKYSDFNKVCYTMVPKTVVHTTGTQSVFLGASLVVNQRSFQYLDRPIVVQQPTEQLYVKSQELVNFDFTLENLIANFIGKTVFIQRTGSALNYDIVATLEGIEGERLIVKNTFELIHVTNTPLFLQSSDWQPYADFKSSRKRVIKLSTVLSVTEK